jgi:hypothetical protein
MVDGKKSIEALPDNTFLATYVVMLVQHTWPVFNTEIYTLFYPYTFLKVTSAETAKLTVPISSDMAAKHLSSAPWIQTQ